MGHQPDMRRRSTRLPGYDYASPGAYFVTVCAYRRECTLDVPELRTVLEETWRQTPLHFPHVTTDSLVVMPNHVHGIVWVLERGVVVGAQHAAPLPVQPRLAVRPGSLGAIVRSFKSASARRVNELRHTPGARVWQRNYYERVIRDEDELSRIREYVRLNPLQWELDRENPHRAASGEHETEWNWLEGG